MGGHGRRPERLRHIGCPDERCVFRCIVRTDGRSRHDDASVVYPVSGPSWYSQSNPLWNPAMKRSDLFKRGSVALMTGLLAVPLIAMTGAAVDLSRAWLVKSRLQISLRRRRTMANRPRGLIRACAFSAREARASPSSRIGGFFECALVVDQRVNRKGLHYRGVLDSRRCRFWLVPVALCEFEFSLHDRRHTNQGMGIG